MKNNCTELLTAICYIIVIAAIDGGLRRHCTHIFTAELRIGLVDPRVGLGRCFYKIRRVESSICKYFLFCGVIWLITADRAKRSVINNEPFGVEFSMGRVGRENRTHAQLCIIVWEQNN